MTHTNATRALTSTAERFSYFHPADHKARDDYAARLAVVVESSAIVSLPYGAQAIGKKRPADRGFIARLRKAINAAPKIRYPYGREAFEGTTN